MTSESLHRKYEFRDIRPDEAAAAARIEQICFPPNEACTPSMMYLRVAASPDLFLVAADRETGEIAGFLNGLATHETKFRDEFFTDVSLCDPDGENVMLLGLDVLPEHRGQGLARELMRVYAAREHEKGRQNLILTCLPDKISMYQKFGFSDLGISASVWGGEEWHEMNYRISASPSSTASASESPS